MDEDIKRIIEDTDAYDEARGDRLLGILSDFYSRRMRPMIFVLWINAMIAIAICVVAAVLFFRTDRVKDEIMYAAIFLFGWGWLITAKLGGWVWFVRHSVTREIKRLEIRLSAAVDAGRQPKP